MHTTRDRIRDLYIPKKTCKRDQNRHGRLKQTKTKLNTSDLCIQKETCKRDINIQKETCKRDLYKHERPKTRKGDWIQATARNTNRKRPAIQTKRDLQYKQKETCKRDQYKHKETRKTDLHIQKRPIQTKRKLNTSGQYKSKETCKTDLYIHKEICKRDQHIHERLKHTNTRDWNTQKGNWILDFYIYFFVPAHFHQVCARRGRCTHCLVVACIPVYIHYSHIH